jgi:adenylate kinase family enzyme
VRRVAVIGGSCTGKTTTSRALADALGVPHIELDALHHDPGWQEASAEVLQARVDTALAAALDGWVADGNYHGKLGTSVLERADTLVFLDLPYRTALRRGLWRTLTRSLTRRELWNGNRETLRNAFSRQSIVWWVIRQHGSYREKWPPRFEPLTHLNVVWLRSARDVRRWLRGVPEATEAMSPGPRWSSARQRPQSHR